MTRWLVGGLLVIAAAVALVRPTDPAAAAPPEWTTFDKAAGFRVAQKGQAGAFYLTRAQVVTLGARPFLTGRRVDSAATIYLPVSEIETVEEYPSVEELAKVYRLPGVK